MFYPVEQHCQHPGCTIITQGVSSHCTALLGCGQVRCPEHRVPPYHRCPDLQGSKEARDIDERKAIFAAGEWEDFTRTHSLLDKDRMQDQAMSYRPGHICYIEGMPSRQDLETTNPETRRNLHRKFVSQGLGGWHEFNYHYLLVFDDGVQWVVRCRRIRRDGPGLDLLRAVMDSEMETMRVVQEAGLKVPRVYQPGPLVNRSEDPGHPVGLPTVSFPIDSLASLPFSTDLYFFMDYVEDVQFPLGRLPSDTALFRNLLIRRDIKEDAISSFITSFALEMIKLSEISFPSLCSLYPCSSGGPSRFGPPINSYLCFHEPPFFSGPFKTSREKWISSIDRQLDSIHRYQNFDPQERDLVFLMYLELRDMVEASEELARHESDFYIRHVDCSGNQMFWNKDSGDLRALLDWEWAQVTTKAEAFAAPSLFGRGQDWNPNLNHWEEKLAQVYVELGRPDLADCVKGGRKYHYLQMLVHPWKDTFPIFGAIPQLRRMLAGEEPGNPLGEDEGQGWWDSLEQKFKDDVRYQEVRQGIGR